jgi:malate dehydrogenase (oxaloacetate-decarboxylating)
VGLGVVASRARRVTDEMMQAAARTLGDYSPALKDPARSLLPPLTQVREVAIEIAVSVGLEAMRAGLAPKTSAEELRERVRETRWTPVYPTDLIERLK